MTAPNAVAAGPSTAAGTGLANAFATSTVLASISTGQAYLADPYNVPSAPGAIPASRPIGTVPQAAINTLANILAACINSDGTTTACTTLFANATADGTSTGARPTDTVTALLNIAHHPAPTSTPSTTSPPRPAPSSPPLPQSPTTSPSP